MARTGKSETKFVARFAKDAVIAAEGAVAFGWYVLLKGRVGVFKGNLQVAEFSERGVIFGELSGILSTPRTATLKALADSEVLHIQGNIDTLIAEHPDITKKILVNLTERLTKTTDELWMSVSRGDEKTH
jgi:CRP/FNR family transcriptional regulator, cyclic AMP receptor protein